MVWIPVVMPPREDDSAPSAPFYGSRAGLEHAVIVVFNATTHDGKKVAAAGHSRVEALLALVKFLGEIPDGRLFRNTLVEAWEQNAKEGWYSKNAMVDAWYMFWDTLRSKYPTGKPLQSLHLNDPIYG